MSSTRPVSQHPPLSPQLSQVPLTHSLAHTYSPRTECRADGAVESGSFPNRPVVHDPVGVELAARALATRGVLRGEDATYGPEEEAGRHDGNSREVGRQGRHGRGCGVRSGAGQQLWSSWWLCTNVRGLETQGGTWSEAEEATTSSRLLVLIPSHHTHPSLHTTHDQSDYPRLNS